MVFDGIRNEVVLFGGIGDAGHFADTWVWSGTAWARHDVPGPVARYRHRMVFDAARGVTVLFGGLAGSRSMADTWVWNGTRWTEMQAPGPEPRNSHGMAYDPTRRRVVLFGGSAFDDRIARRFADTWEWDGMAWRKAG